MDENEVKACALAYATSQRAARLADERASARAAMLLSVDDDWVEAQLELQAAIQEQAIMLARLQKMRPEEADEKAVSRDFGSVRVTWGKRSADSVSVPAEAARKLLQDWPELAKLLGVQTSPGKVPERPTITVRDGLVDDATAEAALRMAGA